MARRRPICVIEIGTARTVCVIGEEFGDDGVRVIGYGYARSNGVFGGEITNNDFAVSSVKAAVKAAEKMSNVTVRQAFLICSGGQIESKLEFGRDYIGGGDRITFSNMEKARRNAEETAVDPDRYVLHDAACGFILDGELYSNNPEKLVAKELIARVCRVTARKQSIDSMKDVLAGAEIEVNGELAAGFAAAMGGMGDELLKSDGVLAINLGAGTTSYSVFSNGNLMASGSFPIGGQHIVRDVKTAFSIMHPTSAERLVAESGSAMLEDRTVGRVAIPRDPNSLVQQDSFSISQRALNLVINARITETLSLVRSRLDSAGLLDTLSSGVMLTGGVAQLRSVKEACEKVFSQRCFFSRPSAANLGRLADERGSSLEFATAYGGLIMAANEIHEHEGRKSHSIFDALFGRD